mgnify:FL=1
MDKKQKVFLDYEMILNEKILKEKVRWSEWDKQYIEREKKREFTKGVE